MNCTTNKETSLSKVQVRSMEFVQLQERIILKFILAAMMSMSMAGCVSFDAAGMHSAVVHDLDTGASLPDVIVVGVFGYQVNDLHSWKFRCTGIELARTNAAGRYEFIRPEDPYRVIAYKADYWEKYLSGTGAQRLSFGMTRHNPYPRPGVTGSADAGQAGDSEFARRYGASDQVRATCLDFGANEWKVLRPLHVEMAKDAVRRASTDGQKIIALDLCRRAANEGDNGGRVDRIGDRYSFIGLEADRLKGLVPECLSPSLMAAKMNANPGRGLIRTPVSIDDPRFLDRAIIRDPSAHQKALDQFGPIFTTILPQQWPGGTNPEDLSHCVGPAPVNYEKGRQKMAELMKSAGVPFRFHGPGATVCVRREAVGIAQKAAFETNAQMRDEY